MTISRLPLSFGHHHIRHHHHRTRTGHQVGGGTLTFPQATPQPGVETPVKDWQGQTIQGLFTNSTGQVLDANGVAVQGLLDKNGTLTNASDNLAITGLTAQTDGTVLDQTGVAVKGLSVGSTFNPTGMFLGPGPELSPDTPFEFRGIQNSADNKLISGWSLDIHTGQAKNSQTA